MRKDTRKIYINGNFLRQPKTGVQRYGHELLDSFDRILTEDPFYGGIEIICLTPPIKDFAPRWKNITVRSFGSGRHHLWENVDLPIHLRGEFLFSPSNIGPILHRNQVVTLHDASVYAVPKAYTTSFKAKYYVILAFLSRLCKEIITDSEFSKAEIRKYLKIGSKHVVPIMLGGDHLSKIAIDESAFSKLGLEKDGYFLLVGSRSKHKNAAMVYKALEKYGYTGKLVHIGGSFSSVFNDQNTHKPPFTVIDPGYVSDSLLRALYKNAKALIFPSIYEGFGFPPLEAMGEGCPVICSNAASLPEVVGNAALTFSPFDEDELIEHVRRIETDPAESDRLREAGFRRSLEFGWETTARHTLDVLMKYA